MYLLLLHESVRISLLICQSACASPDLAKRPSFSCLGQDPLTAALSLAGSFAIIAPTQGLWSFDIIFRFNIASIILKEHFYYPKWTSTNETLETNHASQDPDEE